MADRFCSARCLPLLMLAAALVSGCSMASTTFLTRDEANMGWQMLNEVDGVPVTVKVPTHLKVYIYNKHYLEVVEVAGVKEVRFMEHPPMKDYAHELLYTDMVAMVDFKHPAAKHLDVQISEDHSLIRFHEQMEEELTERAENLLATLPVPTDPEACLDLPAEVAYGTPVGEIDQLVREVKSVAAVGVFEINAPDFEQQVMVFLECHFNGTGLLKGLDSPELLPAPQLWNEEVPAPAAAPDPIITPGPLKPTMTSPPQQQELPPPVLEPAPETPYPIPQRPTPLPPVNSPAIPRTPPQQQFAPPVAPETSVEEFAPPIVPSPHPLEDQPATSISLPLPPGHRRLEFPPTPPEEAWQMPILIPQPVQHREQKTPRRVS